MNALRIALERYLIRLANEYGDEPGVDLMLEWIEQEVSDFLDYAAEC
jgi:hypothetical protein